MAEEGMDKYGVVLDDGKTKEAQKDDGKDKVCPKCGRTLVHGYYPPTCPVCGIEPFEKKP